MKKLKEMNAQGLLLSLWIALLAMSCAPRISKNIMTSYAPLDYREDVMVIDLQTPVPRGSENIGTIKIGDTGFTTNCDWSAVIEAAKIEARKAGGNAIKIVDHKLPTVMGSSCHRITATVLYVHNASEIVATQRKNEVVEDWDYALVHFYRPRGAGPLVNYDIHLGNDMICRIKNNAKTTFEIRTFGRNTIWASTETKTELPVNFEPGREYYIRCGIKMGVLVGRPTLELVDKNTGKTEFAAVKTFLYD